MFSGPLFAATLLVWLLAGAIWLVPKRVALVRRLGYLSNDEMIALGKSGDLEATRLRQLTGRYVGSGLLVLLAQLLLMQTAPTDANPKTMELTPDIRIGLAAGVLANRMAEAGSVVLYVEYPSGKTVGEHASVSPSVVRMILRPAGQRTRAEGLVHDALPTRPAIPGGQEWLESEAGGVRVYKYRTRTGDEAETDLFTGSDGSLVSVQRGEGTFLKNSASRRYLGSLEVLYLYSRELDLHTMDEFTLKFLRQNVSLAK